MDGGFDSCSDGEFEGDTEGVDDGAALGLVDTDGDSDGDLDGTMDGNMNGPWLGLALGKYEGSKDGALEGALDATTGLGWPEMVGEAVAVDGTWDGFTEMDGDADGTEVARRTTDVVGRAVSSVGDGVGN